MTGGEPSRRIIGWQLHADDRAELLRQFPPRYARTVADHVTHGRAGEAPPQPAVESADVLGLADDGAGVEALVVAIAGSSERWDGSTYHITWSLAPGREAKESNAVLAAGGWQAVDEGPVVRLRARQWSSGAS